MSNLGGCKIVIGVCVCVCVSVWCLCVCVVSVCLCVCQIEKERRSWHLLSSSPLGFLCPTFKGGRGTLTLVFFETFACCLHNSASISTLHPAVCSELLYVGQYSGMRDERLRNTTVMTYSLKAKYQSAIKTAVFTLDWWLSHYANVIITEHVILKEGFTFISSLSSNSTRTSPL